MTESVQETPNRAVVAVIAGLTMTQAEEISKAIMAAKDTQAPQARGTIATGKESTVARMIGDGHDQVLPKQKKKNKKKKNKKKSNSSANKNSNKEKNNKKANNKKNSTSKKG